jgi:hypothetical protein
MKALSFALPPEVRYDGVQPGAGVVADLLQFTDLAPGPGHGATFYVLARQAGTAAVLRAVTRKRAEFAAPSMPPPPAVQRRPRRFCAPEMNHY